MGEINYYIFDLIKEFRTGLLLNAQYQYEIDYEDRSKIHIYLKYIYQDDDYEPLDEPLRSFSELSDFIVYNLETKKFDIDIEFMESEIFWDDELSIKEKNFILDYLLHISSTFGEWDLKFIKKHLKITYENDWKSYYKKYKKALKERIWEVKVSLLDIKSELIFDFPSDGEKHKVYGLEYIIILNELGKLDKSKTQDERSEIAYELLISQNDEIFDYIKVKPKEISSLLTYIKNEDSINKKAILKGSKLDKIILDLRNKLNEIKR